VKVPLAPKINFVSPETQKVEPSAEPVQVPMIPATDGGRGFGAVVVVVVAELSWLLLAARTVTAVALPPTTRTAKMTPILHHEVPVRVGEGGLSNSTFAVLNSS
jgi:hypothetical protein